ncbi:MAG TPA: hypothetical protein VMZ52_20430 [Bryobacteraceae bacterium]|nr:hypothetical protein [Bryobacteraceae bacterium]
MSEPWNYFNYFTEIEEHFQVARGTGLFLLSPLDWALVESWKNAGIPLEAVLRGIDAAFLKWHARKKKLQQVNSVAYCTQAVFAEAQVMAGGAPPKKQVEPPFTLEELRNYLAANIAQLRTRGGEYQAVAASLQKLQNEAEMHYSDLEHLEQHLTALEDKMSALARASRSEEELFAARRDLDATLRPYRGKMTAEQLAMLERQYLDRSLLEKTGLPRLSLFYLR